MSNCLFEATLQNIENICNCVPTYFDEDDSVVDVCVGQSLACMKEQNMLMGDSKTIIDSDGTEKVKHVFRSLKLILTNFHSTLEHKTRIDSTKGFFEQKSRISTIQTGEG